VSEQYRPATFQPEPRSPLFLAGWALIIGALIYSAYIIVPPKFMDPQWEFEALGALANNSLLPLLGIALVFHGRQQTVGVQKLFALRVLLAGCLAMGALSLVVIPLAASDQQRLAVAAHGEFVAMAAANGEREKKIGQLIDGSKTIQDLTTMGAVLNLAPTAAERQALHLDNDFEAFKKWTRQRVQKSLEEQSNRTVGQSMQRTTGLEKDLFRIVAVNVLMAFCYFALARANIGLFRAHVPKSAGPV